VIIKTLLFFCLLFTLVGHAQLIDTKSVDIYTGPLDFNAATIKQNKIKMIAMYMVDKPDGAVIVDKQAGQGYVFDTQGRVSQYFYTVLSKTKYNQINETKNKEDILYINDTVFLNIFYDDKDRIITKRSQTGDFYDAYYYEYNAKDQLSKEIHCRETNVSENSKEFKLGVQKILSNETFEYTIPKPTQWKKRCLNDEGREYKKSIINFDDKGNKISEICSFTVSWMRQEMTYEYDAFNRLREFIYKSNESGEVKLKSVFSYDSEGKLLMEQKFKNDVRTNEISYLYDETTNLIKSHINRDFINASITIVKYGYLFY
jgi:hypothetical protein